MGHKVKDQRSKVNVNLLIVIQYCTFQQQSVSWDALYWTEHVAGDGEAFAKSTQLEESREKCYHAIAPFSISKVSLSVNSVLIS